MHYIVKGTTSTYKGQDKITFHEVMQPELCMIQSVGGDTGVMKLINT